eukprot:gene3138-6177_t
MGTFLSKHRGGWDDDYVSGDTRSIVAMQKKLKHEVAIPMEVAVAHFTPASFPIIPKINKKFSVNCNESWQKVLLNGSKNDSGEDVTSGLVMFYNDFYERLSQVDSSGKIESVLSRGASSENKLAAKGGVLVRIVNYVLMIEDDTKATQSMLYMLGVSHAQKRIRPWQYAVLVQTLLLTIAARLDKEATNEIMEGWVNLFAFVMKSMLPPAIEHRIVPTEVHINTSSDFAGGKIAEQVEVLEESRILKKRFQQNSARRGTEENVSMMSARMGAVNRGSIYTGRDSANLTGRESANITGRESANITGRESTIKGGSITSTTTNSATCTGTAIAPPSRPPAQSQSTSKSHTPSPNITIGSPNNSGRRHIDYNNNNVRNFDDNGNPISTTPGASAAAAAAPTLGLLRRNSNAPRSSKNLAIHDSQRHLVIPEHAEEK